MKNLIFPIIVLHSFLLRLAVMFPIFQVFVGFFLVGEFLLLITLGGFSLDWSNQDRFVLVCGIFGFLLALVAGA